MSYPYNNLYLESQLSKLKLAEEIRTALALLRSAIRPEPDHPIDENDFFTDGADI